MAKGLRDPAIPFDDDEQRHLRTLCDMVAPRSRDTYKASSKKLLEALRAHCADRGSDNAAETTGNPLLEALRTIGPSGVWSAVT